MKKTYEVYLRRIIFYEITNKTDVEDELIGITKAVSSKQAINNVIFKTKIKNFDTWGSGYQEKCYLYAKELT